jgi:hypothetical protein
MIGMICFFHGAMTSFQVIANSSTNPAPRDVAAGMSVMIINPLCALICTLPGYLVLATGLLFRTITAPRGNGGGTAHS